MIVKQSRLLWFNYLIRFRIVKSPYYNALTIHHTIRYFLFINCFYLVSKCTLFITASLQLTKTEGVFQPSVKYKTKPYFGCWLCDTLHHATITPHLRSNIAS